MTTRARSTSDYPHTGSGPIRDCPLCGTGGNPLALFESGIEHRFKRPVLPVADYGQALCRGCGLLYINAPIDDGYLVELYSQENVDWQQQYLSENTVVWNGGTSDEEYRRFATVVDLASRFKSLTGARWLDFGCQTGELGEVAQKRHGAQMYGVDVSADYVSRANARWGTHDNARTSLGEFLREGAQFDVVSALETLEHIATPWETLAQLRSVLKPDGILVVTVPSAQYFKLKYHVFKAFRSVFSREAIRTRPSFKGRSIFGLCHTHPYNFSPRSLSVLLERGGFSTVYVGGTGYSRKFLPFELVARTVSVLSGKRVQLYPSVVAIAKPKA